ncbi:hypothetical protein MHPYR_170013 [uncultured Mycobacterium sp.]|uniref:Uncharacterized protein n=1 Tax=uncultured Mycobacterium sp. TaxID=171292 RepID=A0A1Y5P460_9MYCO|nr:hypothetical protein MHPYR_170013 [uncultured Mycobacterium sp.]
MTTASASGVDLPGLAAQLDQDILEAERRLAELKGMRQNIDPLLKYAAAHAPAREPVEQSREISTKASLTDLVVQVFVNDPDSVLDANTVIARLEDDGVEITNPESVRNAIYYGASSGRLVKTGRGLFALAYDE